MSGANEMWTTADIELQFDNQASEGAIVTANIVTPLGILVVMALVERFDDELVLAGLHMHGENLSANSLGPGRLRQIVGALAERLDVNAITIRGATRTSGATTGRLPGTLRFTRKVSP